MRESGRGYPNIDSLKAIAGFFGVTIDELLSGGEALTIAGEEHQRQARRFRNLVFGLLDCGMAMLFFLPFFGQQADGMIRAVSLLSLTGSAPYLRTAYCLIISSMTVSGILTLALHHRWKIKWAAHSLALNTVGVLLFIISRQPYAAVFLLIFLGIKVLILMKKQ